MDKRAREYLRPLSILVISLLLAACSGAATDDAVLVDPNPQILVITTTTLADGVEDQSYSDIVRATGGVTPYAWSISAGGLGPGLGLNSSTGEISGTPAAAGTFNFTVRVSDSSTPQQSDTRDLSITIIGVGALRIVTTSLNDGVVGVAYSDNVAVSGGVPPYTWNVSAGVCRLA